jgi:DNA-binding CsgD family transcriptional regulator
MYVSGMSAAEMANKLDSNEKSVSNAIYRIRKKLKTIIKNNTD